MTVVSPDTTKSTPRLRVLHVIPSIAKEHGGPSLALHQMRAAMRATDIAVEVATTDDGMPELEDAAQIHCFKKATNFYKIAPGFVGWYWSHAKQYDVVHIHALFSFMSTAAALISVLRAVPYVLRPLGTLAVYGVSKRRPWLKRLSIAFVEGPLLRRAARVHFTSSAELAEAQQLNLCMTPTVIPLAAASDFDTTQIEVARADPGPASENRFACPSILYLSRIDPKKNIEGVLAAFSEILGRLPAARLVIAGSGNASYVSHLQSSCESLGIASAVTWAGFATGEAKAKLFKESALYVLPSFAENFGIAVAEALASGLPCVVSTHVALASDIVEYAAGCAVEPDAKSVANAILSLLSDKAKLEEASINARRLANERFSLEALRANLTGLYNTVAAHRAPAGIGTSNA